MVSQSALGGIRMKRMMWMAVICLAVPVAARSQGRRRIRLSMAVKRTLDLYSKNLVAAAQEMPAEKYTYHPDAGKHDFGKSKSGTSPK